MNPLFRGLDIKSQEKMKNSSPKKLSADCWPIVDQQLANSRTTVGQQSDNSRTTVGRQSADSRTTVGRQSDDSRTTVGRESDDSRPTVGRLSFTNLTKICCQQSADCWPHVGNLLAKCRLRTRVEYQKSLSSQGRTLHIDAK